jgi:hypothetical protein
MLKYAFITSFALQVLPQGVRRRFVRQCRALHLIVPTCPHTLARGSRWG